MTTQQRLIAGRYALRQRTRSILLGALYEADDQEGGETVEVALFEGLPSQATRQAVAAFERQLERASELPDRHVITASEVARCADTGLLYAVRRWAPKAMTLAEVVEEVGPLRPSVAARLVGQACRGLMAAHAAGCFHGDLRPENLILEEESGAVSVRLDGFGQGRVLMARAYLRENGRALGDPMWQPPEWIVESPRADEAVDVWGLGACLYTALCGSPPTVAESENEASDPYAGLQTTLLQESAPWVPRRMAEIVHGALLAMPASRCPGADELLEALQSRTGGSLKLRWQMLQTPLSEEARQQRSSRMDRATSWASVMAPEDASDEEDDALLGQVLGQRYKIVRLLGRGGMGAVYEAHDGALRCAIKVVRPDRMEDEELVARFVREARANMSLDNAHVVKVLGAAVDPGSEHLFIAMEMLQGRDLAGHIKALGPLDAPPVVALFIQACEGLAAAHAKGIIHRDVKPANIFLHQTFSGELVTKLVDFGIAKASLLATMGAAPDLTKTGGMLGSPLYMSPEQVRGAKRVTPQTDVWSLAASLYEALSSQRLWDDAPHLGALAITICTTDPPRLSEHAPWLPEGLVGVIHRGLERDLSERWPSVTAFADALRPFTREITRVEPRWLRPAVRSGEGYNDYVSTEADTEQLILDAAAVDALTAASERLPGEVTVVDHDSTIVVSPRSQTPTWLTAALIGLGLAVIGVLAAAIWWMTTQP